MNLTSHSHDNVLKEYENSSDKRCVLCFYIYILYFTPNLSFTHEARKNCIPFLDLKVKLIDVKLETDLYMKPTDRHQYLHYLSSRPEHTKRSIVYSPTLCVNRLCSLEKDFNYHKLNMKEWFIKRGYPESVIDKEMKKVRFSEQGQNSKKVEKGVPLVVT